MSSRRKSSLRDSGISIFSSIARMKRSSASSSLLEYLLRIFYF